jgi:galactokinase
MHVVPPPEERMTGQGHAGQGGAILRIVCNTEIEKRVEQMFEECKRLARENPITIVVQEAAWASSLNRKRRAEHG